MKQIQVKFDLGSNIRTLPFTYIKTKEGPKAYGMSEQLESFFLEKPSDVEGYSVIVPPSELEKYEALIKKVAGEDVFKPFTLVSKLQVKEDSYYIPKSQINKETLEVRSFVYCGPYEECTLYSLVKGELYKKVESDHPFVFDFDKDSYIAIQPVSLWMELKNA